MKPVTFGIVLALVVGGALVHGAATQRWSMFEANPERTARLHSLEVRHEDWQPAAVPTDMPMNERSTGTSWRYTSAASGHTAVLTIISGIPGSVATHTPDVCYPSSGYKTLRGPHKETLLLPDGTTAAVYVADFEKKTQTKVDRVRVRWAWTTDGTWIAPDSPRWAFAGQLTKAPVLYKLYVATPLPEDDSGQTPEDDLITKGFVLAAWSQYGAAFR